MWIKRAVWVFLVITAGVGGYAAGSRQFYNTMIGTLQTEAAGNLTQRIETLSMLQMGDAPAAIARLDSEVDTLVQSIAANPAAEKSALAYVKTYFSVISPSPERARLLASALEGVPVLKPGECKSALKALLVSKGGS